MTSVERMELRWDRRPELHQAVLVAAFEGWNDAGNAASEAVAYLTRAWHGEPFAAFDSEELFDFTSTRPHVRLESGTTRRLEWPELKLSHARLPGADRDVVFLSGPEPQLRWKSFADALGKAASSLNVTTSVLLGALLADVPHTRPVRVSGGSATAELASLAGVEPSYYEGPTGIVGVASDALARVGVPTVSLWASVPHYVSQSSSPKAALALVERVTHVLGARVDVVELEISTAAYERQINELVASDEDASAYVTRLEEQDEEAHPSAPDIATLEEAPRLSPASGERLAAEVERYLREHRRDG
ncbi:MAG TPA: PAC2 family protein [Acidimicrobiales bacterium]|nr:PAC2 family protein [Acidimicrobiales bacterium]